AFISMRNLKYLLSKYAVASDQLSRIIGGTSLQLDTSEKTDEVESLYNGILVDMLDSSDPSRAYPEPRYSTV
ncbi:frigida-like protein, partial [Trifolium medium]|nr:frigida-like protein [Trifolium medium]